MATPPLKFKDQLENNRHMAEATIETLGGKQLLSQKQNQKKIHLAIPQMLLFGD